MTKALSDEWALSTKTITSVGQIDAFPSITGLYNPAPSTVATGLALVFRLIMYRQTRCKQMM